MLETGKKEGMTQEEAITRPTSLNLFRFRHNEFTKYHHLALQGAKFQHDSAVAISALGSAFERILDKIHHSTTVVDDLKDEYHNLVSSVNTGIAFLRIYQELSFRSVPPKDIMSFFISCLSANIAAQTFVINETKAGRADRLRKETLTKNLGAFDSTADLITRLTPPIPHWFKGKNPEWSVFFMTYALTPGYPESEEIMVNGLIRAETLPDWVPDGQSDQLPDLGIVEEELAQDKLGAEQIRNQMNQRTRSNLGLAEILREKSLKTLYHINDQVSSIVQQAESLPGTLLVLDAIDTFWQDMAEAIRGKDKISDEAKKKYTADYRAELVASTTTKNNSTALSRENVALFLEKRFKWADLLGDPTKPLSSQNLTLIRTVIEEALVQQEQPSPRMAELREQNKRLFSFLNYELKPLLGLLSEEELTFLTELFGSEQSSSVEDVILEMAELIESNRFKTYLEKPSKYLAKTLEELRKFTGNWFRNNWQWATQEVKNNLKVEAKTDDQLNELEIESLISTTEIVEQSDQLNATADEAEKGALAGWRLLYTERMVSDENALEEIRGETIPQRIAGLDGFLRNNNISCSIGADSVVETFNWLVEVPEEIEWTRMSKVVNGEEWKKLKRGRVRFFYQMDKSSRQIVFFLHQKKAWGYNF